MKGIRYPVQICTFSLSIVMRGVLLLGLSAAAFSAFAGESVKIADTAAGVQQSSSDRQGTFGVPLYPGAKPDANASAFLESSGMRGGAYRTDATLTAVGSFYDRSKLKRRGTLASEYVLFGAGCREEYVPATKETVSLGCAVDVILQSPWMDPQTGQMKQGTLISIVNNAEGDR